VKDHDDRLFEILASLPPITPDVQWESRVRARCHSVISRGSSRPAGTRGNLSAARIFDVAGAVALCGYLAAMLTEAVRLGSYR
jgi:hypothetical protein